MTNFEKKYIYLQLKTQWGFVISKQLVVKLRDTKNVHLISVGKPQEIRQIGRYKRG